jgi:anaerobic C4-dicarboxylate transporter DcuB
MEDSIVGWVKRSLTERAQGQDTLIDFVELYHNVPIFFNNILSAFGLGDASKLENADTAGGAELEQIAIDIGSSLSMFLSTVLAVIVMFAVFPELLPTYESGRLKMNLVIQIVMIAAAALMIIFCKAQPKKAVSGPVWQSGMVAVVAIYGIAWLADTYFSNYMPEIQGMLEDVVKTYPWSIALVFFLVSVLINSQGAVVVAMLPLAYNLGIPGAVLLGVLPSVYGYFFIPNYPSDIATVNFDRSGTTVIGKYLLNHSFMMPGMIHVTVATIMGYVLSSFLL